MGEKLNSSLVSLAAVALAPVPGSSEMWLATTTMMWLDKDQAWQHVVYEHPRDADTESILSQFQSRVAKARNTLAAWFAMPPSKRKNCVLIHNASVRRVIVKTHLVNAIDGSGDSSADWTAALDAHPLGSVMKKALTFTSSAGEDEDKIIIGAQRMAIVPLPPKPDMNWGWRGTFSYGDTKVGECRLREGGVFSFICVDCGLRVLDREEDAGGSSAPPTEKGIIVTAPQAEDGKEESNPTASEEEEGGTTCVEVANRTDEPLTVKIFEPGASGHKIALFKSPIGEGIIGPGTNKSFQLRLLPNAKTGEADYDVEIRVGNRKAKCEVVGEQIIFVDGIMADS